MQPTRKAPGAQIPNRIAIVRAERRITQRALAEKVRIPAWVLSRFENGHALPTPAQMAAVAKALMCSPEDLYSFAAIALIREADAA